VYTVRALLSCQACLWHGGHIGRRLKVVRAVLEAITETDSHLFDSFDDLGAVAKCRFAVDVRYVVQIDVDGKSRQIEIEKIQRWTAFDELSAKKRVFVKLF